MMRHRIKRYLCLIVACLMIAACTGTSVSAAELSAVSTTAEGETVQEEQILAESTENIAAITAEEIEAEERTAEETTVRVEETTAAAESMEETTNEPKVEVENVKETAATSESPSESESEPEPVLNGLVERDGAIYYYENGKVFTGGYKNLVIDGTRRFYYFGSNGKAFAGGLLEFVHTNGKTYYFYFDKDGQAYTKGYRATTTSYYAGTDHVVKKGVNAGTTRYYYFKSNGQAFCGGLLRFVHTNDKTYYYYFGKNGQAYTKGYVNTTTSSYAGKDCVIKSASNAGTTRYYYFRSNGQAFCGGLLKFIHTNGKTYYFFFTSDGTALTSTLKRTGSYYVGQSDFSVVKKSDGVGRTFYFKSNGHGAVKEWITTGGDTYYFGANAVAVTGKQIVEHYLAYFSDRGVMTRRIDKDAKMVALTYDDGPAAGTSTILNVLEKYDSVATFFVVGSRVSSYKSTVKRAYDMGCEIGNHTYDHKILTSCSSDTISSQLSKTNSVVKSITGENMVVMRPPGGGMNSRVKSTVGMPLILWSIDTRDWEHRNASKTVSIIKNQVRDGDIVLMHDLHNATAEASKTLIPWLVNQGYQLVTISELGECRGGYSKGVAYFSMK